MSVLGSTNAYSNSTVYVSGTRASVTLNTSITTATMSLLPPFRNSTRTSPEVCRSFSSDHMFTAELANPILAPSVPEARISFRARTQLSFAFVVATRSEEHTSELQSLMRTSYAVFCLQKQNNKHNVNPTHKKIINHKISQP